VVQDTGIDVGNTAAEGGVVGIGAVVIYSIEQTVADDVGVCGKGRRRRIT